MAYVDGFVIPVPKAKKEAYRRLAEVAAPIYLDHGAIKVVECWGDEVPDGKLTSFPMAVKLEPDEAVVFSWIIWPSKAVRDAGNASAMTDPRMTAEEGNIPFDGKRMILGGFEVLLDRD